MAGRYSDYGTPLLQVENHYFQVQNRKVIFMNIVGIALSAISGICFCGGIAVLLGGKEH